MIYYTPLLVGYDLENIANNSQYFDEVNSIIKATNVYDIRLSYSESLEMLNVILEENKNELSSNDILLLGL
jgi:hypothetical protein